MMRSRGAALVSLGMATLTGMLLVAGSRGYGITRLVGSSSSSSSSISSSSSSSSISISPSSRLGGRRRSSNSISSSRSRRRRLHDPPRAAGAGGRMSMMCGVAAIRLADGTASVALELYDSLTLLQHRGQDAAGIATAQGGRVHLWKDKGLVRDVLTPAKIGDLPGSCGIGHVRYPTAGANTREEAQPFFHNVPLGFALAHNGHLTNVDLLKESLSSSCHFNTDSDSEVLGHLLGSELAARRGDMDESDPNFPGVLFDALQSVYQKCHGGFAVVAVLRNQGLLAFRDAHGIRPLCFGSRMSHSSGRLDWAAASESVAFTALGFSLKRDVAPGEAVYVDAHGTVHSRRFDLPSAKRFSPCIFEWVYMARPDSVLDGVSVYDARANMGRRLVEKVRAAGLHKAVDVIVPVPETSRISAMHLALSLGIPYEEGLVKNRYIGRTFITSGQKARLKQVKKKLSPVQSVFAGRRVLLVDDSVVRGTTSRQIIEMVRAAGALEVHFASMSPPVRHCNIYGIDLPRRDELVAFGLTDSEVAEAIGAESIIFQDLASLHGAVAELNPSLATFEDSIFTGNYVVDSFDEDQVGFSLTSERTDDAGRMGSGEWDDGTSQAPPPHAAIDII